MGLLDEELPSREEKDLRLHVKECKECRRELEEFNEMKGVIDKMKYKEPHQIEK